MAGWSAWRLDFFTWAWIFWMVAFLVLEFAALWRHQGQELTAHLRPVFQSNELIYLLAIALWVWLGVHFLIDQLWLDVGSLMK